ncbi:LysR family transcriptional regulator [Rhizobiaceae bacterium BDR2-2]|uniref:LysR family transcriptional regulator n=1 Tax=Ectorhizobium quercum TaxID=2965071 RepID=A0AAE3N4B6_9HYPH|nr:LysR family transcriptional regulator [Ectorhizobium quercum]MCX8999434.1 LysR family transcriptional regulator [Ectorhizobium quercum]
MKLEGLASFVAVAETGSISRAAKRLNLSTSVVSERLARLERDVGAALVHRTTRKLTLTEDGAAFRGRAAAILREVDAAAVEIAERRGGLVGPLRLSAPLSFGVLHLGRALYPFLTQHPGVELIVELDDDFVDVAAGGYDAVVRIGQVADNRLVAHRLAPSRRALVAAPAYLERHGYPRTLDDLSGHRAINYSNRGAEDWRFKTSDGMRIARPRAILRVNNGDLMREAAEAGLGLALLPTFITGEALASGHLKVVRIDGEAETDTVQVVYPKALGIPSKVKALVEHLRARFGDPPYWDRAIDQET